MRRLRPFLFLLLLPALLVAAACGGDDDNGSSPGGAGGEGGPLVVALNSEPTNLNPIFLDLNAGNWPAFNGLVAFDKDLDLVPDLAAEMPTVSDDGLTVTVKLRDDVTFHDGEPFTSEDVVFTWEAILDPAVATPLRERFALRDLVASVEAIDDTTVEFKLNRRDPAFIERLYVGIVPAHVLEGQDINSAAFNRAPIGTGPFVFREWRGGDRLIFDANENYHGGEVGISQLVMTFVGDENSRVAMLQNGEIDFARLTPRAAETFESNPQFQVVQPPSASIYQMTLPNANPLFADARVRQALNMAVNREAIASALIGKLGKPAYGPFTDAHWAYDPESEIPYDVERAKELLEEAGWTDTNGDGVIDKDGVEFRFTIIYLASNADDQEYALALRADFAELGIEAEVEGVASGSYDDRLTKDAFFHGVGMPYDPEYVLRPRFHSEYATTTANPAQMASPAVDAALDRAREVSGREERRETFIELQRAAREDGSYLYIAERPTVVVASSAIGGFEPQLMGSPHGFVRGLAWNIAEWTWQ